MENTSPIPAKGNRKLIVILLVIGLIALVVILDMRRRDVENKLTNLSTQQGGTPEENQEMANKVLEKVRDLMVIPAGIEPTVATIVDVEQLRQRNAFYAKAKNGDYLVVTEDRAILYDPKADKIVDVTAVQMQSSSSVSSAASSKK